jgi:DNA repair protein RadD
MRGKTGMSFNLRPYQQAASLEGVNGLRDYNKWFYLVLATGAGKSLVIADICHKLSEPVLVLQPTKEILEQNYQKLLSYDPLIDAGIYSASKNRREIRTFTYATIGSIYKQPQNFKHFKYVIIDECHLVNPKNLDGMYKKFLDAIGCQNVCGLTATPYRLQPKFTWENGKKFYTSHLKMINRIHPFAFKDMKFKIETADLIKQGYLSPIKYFINSDEWDDLEVNTTGADFTEASLEKFWSGRGGGRLKKLAKCVELIDRTRKLNLIFCSSILQANKLQAALDLMDIKSQIVTGTTPLAERETAIENFKSKRIRHMINVGVFTTGFDVPELDSITLARPTMSLALYYQMIGRGVRLDPADPDKELHVYDIVGCVERLGRVETIRLGKEPHPKFKGFWMDTVSSETGRKDEVPLFKFLVKKNIFAPKEEATK